MEAESVIFLGFVVLSGDGNRSRSRDAETRQQSANTAMNAAVSGLTEAVRSMGQSVSKPRPEDMRVGKARAVRTWQRL